MMSVVLCLQYWKIWVEGGEVTIVSYHESLKNFRSKAEQPLGMMRFINMIEHFGINIVYRKGKANVLAHYLSRPEEISLTISDSQNWRTVMPPRNDNLEGPTEEHAEISPTQIERTELLARVLDRWVCLVMTQDVTERSIILSLEY